MTTSFTIDTELATFTFVKKPEQVRKLSDIPNWSVTLRSLDTKKQVKVYVVIRTKIDGTGDLFNTERLRMIEKEVCGWLYCQFTSQEFIAVFGNLDWLDWSEQIYRGMSKDRSAACELNNFWTRRGRNHITGIKASSKRPHHNSIAMGLDSDLSFITYDTQQPGAKRSITGTVWILGQHHWFVLQHPLFDTSRIMTATDARKIVTHGLIKAFPFMAPNKHITAAGQIHSWEFDSQVLGVKK